MLRTVATLESDQEMRASKAQQLQHVNNWIESLGRYTEGLESDAVQTPLDNLVRVQLTKQQLRHPLHTVFLISSIKTRTELAGLELDLLHPKPLHPHHPMYTSHSLLSTSVPPLSHTQMSHLHRFLKVTW